MFIEDLLCAASPEQHGVCIRVIILEEAALRVRRTLLGTCTPEGS